MIGLLFTIAALHRSDDIPEGILQNWKEGYSVSSDSARRIGDLKDVAEWDILIGRKNLLAILKPGSLLVLHLSHGRVDSSSTYNVPSDSKLLGWSANNLPFYKSHKALWIVGELKPFRASIPEELSRVCEFGKKVVGYEDHQNSKFRWVELDRIGYKTGPWIQGGIGNLVPYEEGVVASEFGEAGDRIEFRDTTGHHSIIKSGNTLQFTVCRDPQSDDLVISEGRYKKKRSKFATTTAVYLLSHKRLKPIVTLKGQFDAKRVANGKVLGIHIDGFEMGASDLLWVSAKSKSETQLEHGVVDFIPF